MDLIFKVFTDPDPATPILGDTNFLSHYTGANRSMAWQELEPGVRQATEKFILPYIGSDLYDDLATKFQADTALSAEQDRALTLLQDAVAYYTAYHVLPERNGFMASMGVVQNTPEGGSQPVPQWNFKTMRWNALDNGDRFLDILLTWLEKQVTDGVAYFDLWKDSDAYQVTGSNFFRQTADLDKFLNIQGSRRSFLSLIKYLRETEEDVIRPIICDDLFDQLATTSADGTISEVDEALLVRIRKAVAYIGLHQAIPHHRLAIDGDGFRVVSTTDQYDTRQNQTNFVHENAIQALSLRSDQLGLRYLGELRAFLAANSADYPLWTSSSCYTAPSQRSHGMIASPNRQGGVGLF